ncbi:glycosyltransferase [Liquorilactobacillus sucicola]|nr:glycosyltransferase family 2 protein [Liquorilactobacillus sucicola]
MNKLVSVIIPIYNAAVYLEQCLTSIQEQTYKELEVLLINDGSTDNSQSICNHFCRKDSRFSLVNITNQGPSAARNQGLKMARGDYIYFADADDLLAPNLVAKVLELFDCFKSEIVAFNYYELYGTQKTAAGYHNPELGEVSAVAALAALFQGAFGNYVWKFIAKRELYIKNNLFFPLGRNFEDVATTYRIFGAATKVYFTAERLYFYRQRSSSVSHGYNSKDVDDLVTTIAEMECYTDHNFKVLRGELRKLEFNLLFMSVIQMNGWKPTTQLISEKAKKLRLNSNLEDAHKLRSTLEEIHRKTPKIDKEYVRQGLKLGAWKLHVFPVLLQAKKAANILLGRR